MNKKLTVRIGLIGCVIGIILLITSVPKYNEAKEIVKMGEECNFGSDFSSAWNEKKDEASVPMWIGVGFLVVFGLFTIIGICSNGSHAEASASDDTFDVENGSISKAMAELEVLREQELITDEEYAEKRAELIKRL